jgi:RHH-type proline utilization regulon transcriptional repressor/proline dehydrogenase/delta 1-pyrroline-5-carboxylate dehydrogenase
VIRTAVRAGDAEMGRQFVLGQTIEEAMARAAAMEAKGYTYSYDMLGEAAHRRRKMRPLSSMPMPGDRAIAGTAKRDIRDNPGISVKLSALHPRYEVAQQRRR